MQGVSTRAFAIATGLVLAAGAFQARARPRPSGRQDQVRDFQAHVGFRASDDADSGIFLRWLLGSGAITSPASTARP
jgi:hypothetical protein